MSFVHDYKEDSMFLDDSGNHSHGALTTDCTPAMAAAGPASSMAHQLLGLSWL
jgi:hypothetical protein